MNTYRRSEKKKYQPFTKQIKLHTKILRPNNFPVITKNLLVLVKKKKSSPRTLAKKNSELEKP